jgi:hypothetical protein
MDRERIIERVHKLLSLSSSDNEHEAAAAAAKVQMLLSEYNLSTSDIPELEQDAKAEKANARTRQRLEQWAYSLARVTADAFDCSTYHSSDGYTFFVGVGADQEVCAWTYGYLYKTLLRMGSAYLRMECGRLRKNASRKTARESYLHGVVHTIQKRLEAQKQETPVTSSALVPVKQSLIQAAMPDDLKPARFKAARLRSSDFLQGMWDGQDIPLSAPLKGHRSRQLQ